MKLNHLALVTAAVIGGVLLVTARAQQTEISDRSYVIDGGTVVVGTVHVRLKGVDAAERGTALGDAATRAMIKIVNGSDLRCTLTGEKTHKRDVGYCFTADGVDINRAIIERGFALACPRYDARYVKYEKASVQVRAAYCERRH